MLCRIVAGIENSLLYYLDLRPPRLAAHISQHHFAELTHTALVSPSDAHLHSVSPTMKQVSNLGGDLQVQIVNNFYKAVSRMRRIFSKQVKMILK